MDAGMLEVRQRWNGECFIQATAALEPVPGVTQSTQLRQEKRQPSSPNYLGILTQTPHSSPGAFSDYFGDKTALVPS